MASFDSLWVWEDEAVRSRLRWYLAVSTNRMPAKYLICRRIPAEFNHEEEEKELWKTHEECAKKFRETWSSIRKGYVRLAELEIPRRSFLDLKLELVKRMLRHCNFCRWNCGVDRVEGKRVGTCQLGKTSRVSTYFHHLGEELPIRGRKGSGTIFFTSCNLRCGFCQNGDISKDKDNGIIVSPRQLALMMWELRVEGCHNINLVGGEPTMHLHTIIEAITYLDSIKPTSDELQYIWSVKSDYFFSYRRDLSEATYQGMLNAPILWNSNMFMSLETLSILREVVDIWLPDFKFGNDKCSIRLARTPWYWETVTRNHKLIYEWGEDIIIRHLVMPNHVECCTKPVLDWISRNMPGVLVNVMDQYHPDCFADPSSPNFDKRLSDIARRPTAQEILEAYSYAKKLGLNFETISWEKSTTRLRLP
jgi:putative pyruvate formate lyase activating enzyme